MAAQIDALPPNPSPSAPSTFEALMYAFLGALATFRSQANALATGAEADAATATAQAVIAAAQAIIASDAKLVALAAANYKGPWASQTGAAVVPYSVSHLGKQWQLTSNLADVTAKTPGTDPEWLEINSRVSLGLSTAYDFEISSGVLLIKEI